MIYLPAGWTIQRTTKFLIVGMLLMGVSVSHAQEFPPPSTVAPASVQEKSEGPVGSADLSSDTVGADDSGIEFGKFTLSPQMGYVYLPQSTYTFNQIELMVDQRSAFMAKIHLDLGGDGLAFEIAPLFSVETICGSLSDISNLSSGVSGGVEGTLISVGGQIGMAFRGTWGSFFPHLGLGFHGSYLSGDSIEYGAELYGRIPIGFTWYLARHFALVAEFAFMYGVTGIRGKMPENMNAFYADLEATAGIDAETARNMSMEDLISELNSNAALSEDDVQRIVQDQISDTIKFGNGFGFEFMVGVRFP